VGCRRYAERCDGFGHHPGSSHRHTDKRHFHPDRGISAGQYGRRHHGGRRLIIDVRRLGALRARHADERREHEAAIRRLHAEHQRLGDRINSMYLDKLDGRIDGAFFDKMSAEWRGEQNRCLREIERHESAEQSYMDEGVQILELARNAQRLFERQEPREKRRLLNFVLSNCTWEDGEVVATFRQPFDFFAETTNAAARHEAGNAANSAKNGIWLGD
jgi:site-specific DNA recombinase